MTPKSQRIGIAIMAIVMLLGTLGSFALFILANDNAMTENEKWQAEQLAEMQRQQEEAERQQEEVAKLSEVYFEDFNEFADRPSSFDAKAVGDEVTYVDLKAGDGEAIDKDSHYRAYYMGWDPKGRVFDGSLSESEDSLKAPMSVVPNMLVSGWYDGVDGMKIGGIREITLPSDLAYGEGGNEGAGIPPNTPLKFMVMVIPEDGEE